MYTGPSLLTVLEAARALGVKPASIYDRIKRGTLAAVTINERMMVSAIEVYCEADTKCLSLLNELLADGTITDEAQGYAEYDALIPSMTL